MKNIVKCFAALILALALCVPTGRAQQKDPRVNPPAAPLPPLSADESSSKQPSDEAAAGASKTASKPDTRPLSGVEKFSLGDDGGGRSFFVPSFDVYQGGDTNVRLSPIRNKANWVSTLSGRAALQYFRGRSQLAVDYVGGGSYYSAEPQLTSSFHEFGIREYWSVGRWNYLLSDSFGYLPESAPGAGSLGGIPDSYSRLGRRGTDLNPSILPSQTILTRSARYTNTVASQVERVLSRRSSFTASAAFSILHFLKPGFIDNRSLALETGYNRHLTGRDTVALSYGLNIFRFSGSDQQVNNHTAHVSYARRITGRLGFNVAIGPQVTTFRRVLSGPKVSASWNLQSSLLYRSSAYDLALNYLRGTAGGSGVLVGSLEEQTGISLTRQMSRVWSWEGHVNYRRNRGFQQTTVTPAPSYHMWGVGFEATRHLGRYTRAYLNYDLENQHLGTPTCAGTQCGVVGVRHIFGLGFRFQFRPIELD